MDQICRLCLSVSNENTHKLSEEGDVLSKICLCLSLQITLDEHLPNSMCSECLNKIEEIRSFKKKVTENQQTLKQHWNNGINDLENFYLSLKNHLNVKEEITEIPLDENKLDISFKNEPDEKQPIVKVEEIIFEETYDHSSDDEILSLPTKAKKKRNTVKIKNKSKTKSISRKERSTRTTTDPKKEKNSLTDSIEAKENLDSTKGDQITDIKFKCLTCFNHLDSKRDLVLHYKQEHGKNVVIDQTIQNCYSTIKKEGTVKYKCGKCGKVYIKKRDIRRHMIAHTENRPFVCNICGRTYKLAADIMMHGRAHEGAARFDCMYECGFSTAYRSALKDHERKHRKGEFKYKCDKCGKGFQVRTHFEEHDNVHKGIKPFVCDICGTAFNASRYLQSHRASVHPKAATLQRYVCVHCSLPCGSRRTLHRHLKFPIFRQCYNCHDHGMTNNGNGTQIYQNAEHGITKSYLCDFCGKSLSSLYQYNSHKRAHLGEKPFSCSTCGKSFTNRTYLRIHERTHTGEKRYACAQCGKRYTRRNTLVRHMRQHTGCEVQRPGCEESLECSKCHKPFTYRSQVVTHEKVCENLEVFKTE